jgi:VanZ family protein
MVGIFVLSSIPGDTHVEEMGSIMEMLEPKVQNALHIPLYGFLCYLWVVSLRHRGFSEKSLLLIALLVTAGYGILDEVYQDFVPGRQFSICDISLNVTGSLIVIGLYQLIRLRHASREET